MIWCDGIGRFGQFFSFVWNLLSPVGSEITMQSDDKMVIEWEARSTVSGLA